jgi:molecular chaperone DnaK (HSP70)
MLGLQLLVAKSCRRSVGSCWRPIIGAPSLSVPLDHQHHQPSLGGCRSFHSTPKQEILPVLAVGALALVGRYSWNALNRMDQEWEDYQWALQQYERQRRKDKAVADAPLTIGVDLGTIYLKLSTLGINSTKADLVPTAQGDRYRFTGILMEKSVDAGGEDTMIVGRPALDKFFYSPESSSVTSEVVLPYRELQKASHDDAAKLVQQVVLPTVGEALERMATSISRQQAEEGKQLNVRTVLTVPPVFFNQHKETIFHQNYHDGSHHTITVPDPVAAIWGAQSVDLLPTPSSKEEIATTSTLVVDIGGLASSVSLVRQDRVIGTSCLDNVGGESYVQQLCERVLKETGDAASIGQDVMSLKLIHGAARDSILELVQKTSSKVHIPFLFMGRQDKSDEPHFDMTISRTVMDQAVQDYWSKSVVPKLLEDGELSASLPPPTNASSILTSAITKVLEESGEVPTNIQHILLVGGGSKFKLFEQALQDGISALMGPSANKLVIPEASLRAELTTMGAAALLPNYDYNYDRGLERV